MHILFTRPLEDCLEIILKFKSLGHRVSHLPLLEINKVNYDEKSFLDFMGIVFTSANAVKYLDMSQINKNILCFCVGSATEKKARSVGFQKVIAADGNVTNLKELIVQNFNSSDGKILYVSGEILSSDLNIHLFSTILITIRAKMINLQLGV